ncbi:MAG TPA: hypothetical protein VK615_11280, partial [Candidatus Binatia bacterium]|nr:hypothetical protein [Candidatus Binatia bacterium]
MSYEPFARVHYHAPLLPNVQVLVSPDHGLRKRKNRAALVVATEEDYFCTSAANLLLTAVRGSARI